MNINNSVSEKHICKTLGKTKFDLIGKQIINICFLIFFTANQFPHTTTIKEVAYYLSLLVFISLFCTRKVSIQRTSPLIPPVLAFIIIVAVESFWALNTKNTLHDMYSHLLRYVILWVIMVSILEKRRDIELLISFVVAATVFFCLYSLIDQYIIRDISIRTRLLTGKREITTNLLGIHTILAINFAIYKLKSLRNILAKAGFSLAIIILLAASFATQTRSTLLALVLSILIIFIINKNFLKLFLLLFVVGALSVYSPIDKRLSSSNMTSNIRIQQIFLCLEIVKDYPLTGIGYGKQTFGKNLDLAAYNKKIKREFPAMKFVNRVLADPHNLYTDILVRTGVIGFIVLIWFIFIIYRTLFKVIWGPDKDKSKLGPVIMASLSSFLLIGFFEPVLSHPFESVLCLILVLVQVVAERRLA